MVEITSPNFKQNSKKALADTDLQVALRHVRTGFIENRVNAAKDLPEFERLRDHAREIKNHTLEHLDLYLEAYEKKVIESGGKVHWAETADDAKSIIINICNSVKCQNCDKRKVYFNRRNRSK